MAGRARGLSYHAHARTALIAEITGRPLAFRVITEEQLRAGLAQAGLPAGGRQHRRQHPGELRCGCIRHGDRRRRAPWRPAAEASPRRAGWGAEISFGLKAWSRTDLLPGWGRQPVTLFDRKQVRELEAPIDAGIAIELTPPTLLRSAQPRRIRARAGVSTLQHRAADGSRDRTSIALVLWRKRYIGQADGYHRNKSAVAIVVGGLASPHFQPQTQRRPI